MNFFSGCPRLLSVVDEIRHKGFARDAVEHFASFVEIGVGKAVWLSVKLRLRAYLETS